VPKFSRTLLPYGGIEIPHATVYDLLGYVLSNASQAPPNAGPDKFHRPLLFMYTRMCLEILSDIRKRAGPDGIGIRAPQMGHLSWVTEQTAQDQLAEFLLTAGDYPEDTPQFEENFEPGTTFSATGMTGSKETVGGKTTSLRSDQQALNKQTLEAAGYDTSEKAATVSQEYGHCAESLPLVYLTAQYVNPDLD
jgi:hypothetical protein